jgi:hypothetical protein
MASTIEHLGLDQPAVYRIRVQGELDADWAAWLDDGQRISSIAITIQPGITTVTGTVVDQPALYGLLSKIRDLSLTLLSVSRIDGACCSI